MRPRFADHARFDRVLDDLSLKAVVLALHRERLGEADLARQRLQIAIRVSHGDLITGPEQVEPFANAGQQPDAREIRQAEIEAAENPIQRIVAPDHHVDSVERKCRGNRLGRHVVYREGAGSARRGRRCGWCHAAGIRHDVNRA